MTNNDESQWITRQEAAQLTGLSARSVLRYASEPENKLRTRKRTGSKQFFYYRPDVEALAMELEVAKRPPPLPPEPKPEMLPAGAMLEIVREKDTAVDHLQREIRLLTAELARVQSEAERRVLPGQVEDVERRLVIAETRLEGAARERDEWKERYNQLSGRAQRASLVLGIAFLILIVALTVLIVILSYG